MVHTATTVHTSSASIVVISAGYAELPAYARVGVTRVSLRARSGGAALWDDDWGDAEEQ